MCKKYIETKPFNGFDGGDKRTSAIISHGFSIFTEPKDVIATHQQWKRDPFALEKLLRVGKTQDVYVGGGGSGGSNKKPVPKVI